MESLGVYSINTIIWSRLDWALNEIRGLRRVRNDVIGQLLAELVSESNQPLLSMDPPERLQNLPSQYQLRPSYSQ
jgi:hypothetical protein